MEKEGDGLTIKGVTNGSEEDEGYRIVLFTLIVCLSLSFWRTHLHTREKKKATEEDDWTIDEEKRRRRVGSQSRMSEKEKEYREKLSEKLK
uniref:Uncharacterized protein n=1 Tax=Pristionchus pacificus TaxID=54126 RepID=A0A2A6B5Y9_PRIPA|eukprot:PDM61296.1 hypothetical protein PRIPAC_50738 [Pristionchus pacificus]